MDIHFERRCWAEINLDQLRKNFKIVQKAAPHSTIMAVVKANAYGHGDVAAARAFEAAGANFFAVSGLAEAVRLRNAGITWPILVLGYTSPENVVALAEHNIQQCIFSLKYAQKLSYAATIHNCAITTHLKVDTGMGRLGFSAKDDLALAVEEIAQVCHLPGLQPEGIFTHFACADSISSSDVEYTKDQFFLFKLVCSCLADEGYSFKYKHSCNSAGLIAYPEMHQDLVRPGIILYGCNPSSDVFLQGLAPAFQLKTVVTMVKTVNKGDCVSYGRIFTAPCTMTLATLAVGYADGYPRSLSNNGVVSIHGKPAKIVGRICMDQVIVDVSNIPEVQLGDIAILFGGDAADSIDEVATKSDTINYEILCNIGQRVQRVYFEEGRETMLADYIGGIL